MEGNLLTNPYYEPEYGFRVTFFEIVTHTKAQETVNWKVGRLFEDSRSGNAANDLRMSCFSVRNRFIFSFLVILSV